MIAMVFDSEAFAQAPRSIYGDGSSTAPWWWVYIVLAVGAYGLIAMSLTNKGFRKIAIISAIIGVVVGVASEPYWMRGIAVFLICIFIAPFTPMGKWIDSADKEMQGRNKGS